MHVNNNDIANATTQAVQQSQSTRKSSASATSASATTASATASATTQQTQKQSASIKIDTNSDSSADSKSKQESKQDALVKAVEKVIANDGGESIDLQFKELRFSYHEDTQRMMVKVVDQDTEEIIREIPSKEVLDMLAAMWDAAGLFVDVQR
ncbi:MAG: hypothetical protein ATN34_04205 [Epulopiscium sp. Nele67-Bin002]|nr:MAG: hypothetical protein BEN18_03500 [Epulopiscium sp. Nuni2H_MBin001]OON92544.1 MAG: hypothetical protein ATN34_04205 [Epulopiscium sp. Nele67-Bin002]